MQHSGGAVQPGPPRAGVVALLLVLVLAGCGQASPTAGASPSAAPDGPQPVALRYLRALFSSNPTSAAALVEPASQEAFKLVLLGIGQQHLSARDLDAAPAVITGDRARVVALGSLCRTSSAGATPDASDCISNSDPDSTNPIFRVDLLRASGGSWLVSLQPDTSSPSSAPEPAPATSSAAHG